MSAPTLADPRGGDPNALALFVLGPGFGECQVALFPDGRVLVVDACMDGPRNLGAELLKKLGVTKVDLFVVSHPDKDHVLGADGVMSSFSVEKLWMYPASQSVRTVLARAMQDAEALGLLLPRTMVDLKKFLDAVRSMPSSRWKTVKAEGEWTFSNCGYAVYPIAPVEPDYFEQGEKLQAKFMRPDSVSHTPGRVFVDWVQNFLDDEARADDHANFLSVALSMVFGSRRILLAGDVECARGGRDGGWGGVMRELADPSTTRVDLGLLRDLDVIKVAHHGSHGAVHPPAWREHCSGGSNPLAIVAPFNRGRNPPPTELGLRLIRQNCKRLAFTSTSTGVRDNARAAGWSEDTSAIAQPEDFPMVGVCVPQSGPIEFSIWGSASLWTSP